MVTQVTSYQRLSGPDEQWEKGHGRVITVCETKKGGIDRREEEWKSRRK